MRWFRSYKQDSSTSNNTTPRSDSSSQDSSPQSSDSSSYSSVDMLHSDAVPVSEMASLGISGFSVAAFYTSYILLAGSGVPGVTVRINEEPQGQVFKKIKNRVDIVLERY